MPRSSLAAAAALGAVSLSLALPRPLWPAAQDAPTAPAAQATAAGADPRRSRAAGGGAAPPDRTSSGRRSRRCGSRSRRRACSPCPRTTGSRTWTSSPPRRRSRSPSKNGWPSSSSPSSTSPRSRPTSFPPATSPAPSASPAPTPPCASSGLVRMTAVNTFGPLGTEDRFVTSSIPVAGTPEAGKQARTVYTANPSRFSFDMRTPTGVGAMRAFIEGDFAGSGRTLRLRHAYGQWGPWIAGQTWSTFADPEAEPDGIDFEGLNAISLFRQTQVRFTHKLKERGRPRSRPREPVAGHHGRERHQPGARSHRAAPLDSGERPRAARTRVSTVPGPTPTSRCSSGSFAGSRPTSRTRRCPGSASAST